MARVRPPSASRSWRAASSPWVRTLAICLGLQLFAARSAESPGVTGLARWPLAVEAFPRSVRVPQLGWNRVTADGNCRILRDGTFYFANSYRLTESPAATRAAWGEHGGRFVAAMEDGPLLACQFHPELSGPAGADLLGRWLESSPAPTTEAVNP